MNRGTIPQIHLETGNGEQGNGRKGEQGNRETGEQGNRGTGEHCILTFRKTKERGVHIIELPYYKNVNVHVLVDKIFASPSYE